jgi:hypothetical protein
LVWRTSYGFAVDFPEPGKLLDPGLEFCGLARDEPERNAEALYLTANYRYRVSD